METQIRSLPTIEVKLRKPSPFRFLRRIIFLCLFLIAFCFSIFLMCTIVGIIPGFFMFVGSGLFLAGVFDAYTVECPNCKKKNHVLKKKEDFECKRCHQPVIIEWIKK